MHAHAHFGLGWMVGVLTPGSDRRLRVACATAAVIPDLDSAGYLLGEDVFWKTHHTFGHNVFFGVVAVAGLTWFFRRSPRRAALVALLATLLFASHLATDAYFTGWEVHPLWPASDAVLPLHGGYFLWSPINTALIWAAIAVIFLLAYLRQVTPLEILSPRLDTLVLDSFRAVKGECKACPAKARHRCDGCGEPVCLRHGRVTLRFALICGECAAQPGR